MDPELDPVLDPVMDPIMDPAIKPSTNLQQNPDRNPCGHLTPKDSKLSIGLHNSLPQIPNLATIPLTYLLTYFFPKIKDLNNLDLLSIIIQYLLLLIFF